MPAVPQRIHAAERTPKSKSSKSDQLKSRLDSSAVSTSVRDQMVAGLSGNIPGSTTWDGGNSKSSKSDQLKSRLDSSAVSTSVRDKIVAGLSGNIPGSTTWDGGAEYSASRARC